MVIHSFVFAPWSRHREFTPLCLDFGWKPWCRLPDLPAVTLQHYLLPGDVVLRALVLLRWSLCVYFVGRMWCWLTVLVWLMAMTESEASSCLVIRLLVVICSGWAFCCLTMRRPSSQRNGAVVPLWQHTDNSVTTASFEVDEDPSPIGLPSSLDVLAFASSYVIERCDEQRIRRVWVVLHLLVFSVYYSCVWLLCQLIA